MSQPDRIVGCELVVSVIEPTRLAFQVAPFDTQRIASESLEIISNGEPVSSVEVVADLARVHALSVEPGPLEVRYQATIRGLSDVPLVTPSEEMVYLRPSRYAESDRLTPMAREEFAGITKPVELLAAVSSWVGTRLAYMAGSSGPTDGAVDTMLDRQGVCRDFAHLTVALLRALDVPARLVAVYAPGLEPMDFHAVAEAAIGGTWWVVDPTLLAPRSSLIRICTGRDAADTAFMSNFDGRVELLASTVIASVDGPLPTDDVNQLVSIG